MAKENRKITVWYVDNDRAEVFEYVAAMLTDDGLLQIYFDTSELTNGRMYHRQILIPFHRIARVAQEFTCSKAEHKANEAQASAWADLRAGGLHIISGMAQEGDEGA